MRTAPRALLLVLAAALILAVAGCGARLDTARLQNKAATVQSYAAEGSLVARGVTAGSTTVEYVTVHGGELSQAAGKLAAELRTTPPAPGMASDARRLSRLASLVAGQLGRLANAPSDRRLAAAVAVACDQAARVAGRMTGQ